MKKGSKRSREAADDEKPKAKKIKTMEDLEYLDESKVQKLTVVDLKAYLKVCGNINLMT